MNYEQFAITVTRHRKSGYAAECRYADEEGHDTDGSGPECNAHCRWLDGDTREITPAEESVIVPDADDIEQYGYPAAWAINYLRGSDFPVLHASFYPVKNVQPYDWLSGTEEHMDESFTETTVRLTGEGWGRASRTLVFRKVPWS